jgi:hypothetical protein
MTLTEEQLRRCLFCVIEEHTARHRDKWPGPARWTGELIKAITDEITGLSRPRQSEDSELSSLENEDRWLSCQEVSAMTGWHVRRLQRRYQRLGGQKIGRQIIFRESAIREHLEGTDQ